MKTTIKLQLSSLIMAMLTLLAFVMIFTLTSCEPTDTNLDSKVTEIIETEEFASQNFDDLEDLGDDAVTISLGSKSTLNQERIIPDCATITREIVGDTVYITVDFGTEGCTCNDGKVRKGILFIKHTGNYWADQKTVIFETEDYFVDDNQLIGKKTVTRFASNEDGYKGTSHILDGEIILADESGSITWHSERERLIIEGSATQFRYDDVIQVTGSSYGTTASGDDFSSNIVEPLIKNMEFGCRKHFVKGTIEITRPNGDFIVIDFGDGECDDEVSVTLNGEIYTHTFKNFYLGNE